MAASSIASVKGRQILDSRGRPTVEADVRLADGSFGRASAPSGASTGRHEARELRDRDPAHYEGLGVLQAVRNVNEQLAAQMIGRDALDQQGVDDALLALDTSARFETLGSNAVLAVSLAASRAASASAGVPLYRYIHSLIDLRPAALPMPMTNILSGGAHARRSMDVQDFLVIPTGAQTYGEALAMIARVRSAAAQLMQEAGLTTLLADEGGLSPAFATCRQALDLMLRSFEAAGLRPGEDVAIALDVAASELARDGTYVLSGEGRTLSGEEMVAFMTQLVAHYPIVSVEDPLDQDDWSNWAKATDALSAIQLVGDDLFVTNTERIQRGVAAGVGNTVLVKLNQNGTLSGTLAAMRTAWSAGYATIVSARSGETEDNYIADLAVGSGAGQIKIGSVRNSERLSKYNQLSRIEEDGSLPFSGMTGCAIGGRRAPKAR